MGGNFDRNTQLETSSGTSQYFSNEMGWSLENLMAQNLAKLQARYPHRFSQEHTLQRNLDHERTTLETHASPEPTADRLHS